MGAQNIAIRLSNKQQGRNDKQQQFKSSLDARVRVLLVSSEPWSLRIIYKRLISVAWKISTQVTDMT